MTAALVFKEANLMNSHSIRGAGRALGVAALATNLIWMTAPASLAATTIEAGTVLPVKLNDTLSSKDSRNGDSFSATIRTDESSYYNNLPVGTKIEGTVRQAR